MSYLSASENVGFSGIPQNISDASCATQYKMAVEGVSGCNDVNMFIHDNSGDEQNYITQFNDNFYTKFKIDPNELYTFHDSDVVAGEITVSQTDDNYIFDSEAKNKYIDSPNKDLDILAAFTNGDIREEKKEAISNGHYAPNTKPVQPQIVKEAKTTHTKVAKAKSAPKEPARKNSTSAARRASIHSPNAQNTTPSTKTSINSTSSNAKNSSSGKQSASETFLDVFKREQGLIENASLANKTDLSTSSIKVPTSPPKKAAAGKTATQSKSRRGRGPAVHEALQRIPAQKRAVAMPCRSWHAPGHELFDMGPLDSQRPTFTYSSSSDDETPDINLSTGELCVEEFGAESREARFALRRAAMRRHVRKAKASLKHSKDFKKTRTLVNVIQRQLTGSNATGYVSTQVLNHCLALRGMNTLFTSEERRKMRESGWSGGESGATESPGGAGGAGAAPAAAGGGGGGGGGTCAEEACGARVVPCARYCLAHVTLQREQLLFASCAAVFAGGARCRHPLLPLAAHQHTHTPLCAEHAWKRDNYDKLSRDCRPKKVVRTRVVTAPRPPRPARAPAPRRRRARDSPPPTITADQSLSEINVCSNSSAYDSSEETAMGPLSENEFIAGPSGHNDIEVEVGQVPPDDILDPAVLSQIPDEAFTEFFNQEGGGEFAESSELAAALEAVLDERMHDTMDHVFTHPHAHPHPHAQPHPHPQQEHKIQAAESIQTEMSSDAPS